VYNLYTVTGQIAAYDYVPDTQHITKRQRIMLLTTAEYVWIKMN